MTEDLWFHEDMRELELSLLAAGFERYHQSPFADFWRLAAVEVIVNIPQQEVYEHVEVEFPGPSPTALVEKLNLRR